MIFIHSLRMIADISVYFFIAELITVSLGRPSQFVQFLLLGGCYGLGVLLQSRDCNKLYLLLPIAVLLLPGSYPLALIAPATYIFYLLYTQHTNLSWDRQTELFTVTVKFFPVAGVVICFLGYSRIVLQYAVPMAFISLAASVFLMRMLRHPPAVYLDPQYLRKNCTVFFVVLTMAWLLSREIVFEILASGLHFMYMKTVYPVFNALIWLFMAVLKTLMYIFSWFKLGEIKFEENHLSGGEMGPTFKDAVISGDHVATTESILTILLVGILLVIAFYFFRWLALHKGEESFISQGLDIIRGKNTTKPKKERATTTVLQVRRQYRLFLKLYKEHGGKLETAFTSEDVLNHSANVLADAPPDVLAEMRQIYLNARYGGTATKADLKRIRQINKELMTKD